MCSPTGRQPPKHLCNKTDEDIFEKISRSELFFFEECNFRWHLSTQTTRIPPFPLTYVVQVKIAPRGTLRVNQASLTEFRMGRYNQCFFFHKNVFIFTRAKHFAGKKGLLVVYNHTSSMHQYSVLLTLQARALGLGKEDYATSNEDWIDASENLVFLW